jgi:hypothetical protein
MDYVEKYCEILAYLNYWLLFCRVYGNALDDLLSYSPRDGTGDRTVGAR